MDTAERKELEAERARLVARLGEIDAKLRELARAERAEAAPPEGSGQVCQVLLGSTGRLGRWDSEAPLPTVGARQEFDVIVSVVKTRGDFGVLTSRGRLVKASAQALPAIMLTQDAPDLRAGKPADALLGLAPGERPLALTTLGASTFGWALGTRQGTVKRTNPEMPRGQESWEVIRLEDGDEVVGAAELRHEQQHLVFITTEGQLLHYPAAAVRPQGRQGGGMAGVKLGPGAQAIFFGAADLADAVVVTNAGKETGRETRHPGSIKVTPFSAFPEKGRATGGVRCHRFLKGEDTLYLGWVGLPPAIAATADGFPSNLPAPDPRRDGSGTPASIRIAAVGSRAW
ncbi:MAG: hypothetical protein LBQ92_05790 [Propionibacteriaceae bacterium]|jgi:DNA gyrase subunit A|nr:hypothetical protein [Propionibacteriaceae bacterium]